MTISIDYQKTEGAGESKQITGLTPETTLGELKDKIAELGEARPSVLYELGTKLEGNDTTTLGSLGLKIGRKHYLSEVPMSRPGGGRKHRKSRKTKRRSTKKRRSTRTRGRRSA